MPLDTIASAVARIVLSSTLSLKWFQLFHPIGGVAAAIGVFCVHATEGREAKATATINRAKAANTVRKRMRFIETPKHGSGNATKYTYTFRGWLGIRSLRSLKWAAQPPNCAVPSAAPKGEVHEHVSKKVS